MNTKHLVTAAALLASTALGHSALTQIALTADLANSQASGFGGSMANTTSDPFAFDPNDPTAALPATNWSPATHFHGNGGNPIVYWGFEVITWGEGSDLQFDFYGRTACCPDRDNNYDIALLSGGPGGTVIQEVLGNNAPDAGNPANYLRTDLGAGLAAGQSFDTVRIVGNNPNFSIAEVRLSGSIIPEPSTSALFGLATIGLFLRRRR